MTNESPEGRSPGHKVFNREFSPAALGISFAVLSTTLSSIGTLFKVRGVHLVPPVPGAIGGVLFAGILSLLYLAWRKQLPSLKDLRRVAKPLVCLILCRPVFANILFTIGLSMSSGIKAVFLTKMEPYLIIFWTWVIDGVRPSRKHLSLLIIHLFGALLLSVGNFTELGNGGHLGDLIIALAVITAALSYRFAPRITAVLNPIQTSTVSELLGGLITLPLAFLYAPTSFGPEEQWGWICIGIHSILFYAIAIPLLYASLHRIAGWQSSALRAVGPIIAAPIAWIGFGERLGPSQIVGALVVIVTSALISKSERRSPSLQKSFAE